MADAEKTTIIAKVGAKIYPVTDGFYREAKRDLEREEDRLERDPIKVPVETDSQRVTQELRDLLRRLGETARRNKPEVGVTLDDTEALAAAKVVKERIDKSLGEVDVEVRLKQNRNVLDELARPDMFQKLQRQVTFDPSSMRQYTRRLKEINDQVRAGAKLEAQRAAALKKQAADQAKAIKDRLASEARLAKIRDDQRKAQTKAIADEIAGRQRVEKLVEKAAQDARDAAEKTARAAKAAEDAQRAAYLQQLQAEQEMRRAFNERAKATRRAAADEARLTRELAASAREARRLRDQIEDLRIKKLVDPDTYGELRALQTELRDLDARLRVSVHPEDREKIKHEAGKIRDEIEDKLKDIPAEVKPHLAAVLTREIQLRLARLARDRIVMFVPMVSKVAAARVATTLSALSGLRGAASFLEDLNDAFKDLDKNIPKIAALSTGILTLGGYVAGAVANIFSLANSIAVAAQAGLALPGILGGMAIGAGVTFIALKDLNKQIPEAKKGWKQLSSAIKTNFWSQAEEPIRRLGKELFPDLLRGIKNTSLEIGGFFAAFANGLRTELGGNPLKNMFADLNDSVDIFTDHAGSIAKIIRILGEAGAGELPRLADWFGKLTDRFSNFLDKADKSGELKKWIDEGIEALKQMGTVIKGVSRIFAGLGRAAIAGGSSTLESLGERLNAIADVINGPAFQGQITRTLQAVNGAMSEIARRSGPALTNMFMALGRTSESVFPTLGRTVGTVLETIAEAIANPRLQRGIIEFFNGIEKAVETLAPAFDTVAPAFGELLSLLGTMAEAFAPIGKVLLETVAQAFIELAPSLDRVVKALAGGVADVLTAIAPAIVTIADASGPALEAVANALADMAEALAPVIAKTAQDLAKWISETVKSITPAAAQGFADGVGKLAKALLDLIDALLKGKDGQVTGYDLGGFLQRVGEFAGELAKAVEWASRVLPPFIQNLKDLDAATDPDNFNASGWNSQWKLPDWLKQWDGLFPMLIDTIESGWASFKTSWDAMWDKPFWGSTNWGPRLGEFLKTEFGDAFGFLTDPVQWQELGARIKTNWDTLINDPMWTSIGEVFKGIGRDIWEGLKAGVVESATGSWETWRTICQAMIDFVKGIFGIHSPSTVFAEIGGFLIAGLIQGISSAPGLLEVLNGIAESIKNVFVGAGEWLTSKGSAVITGLRNGMSTAASTATTKMSEIKQSIMDRLSNANSYLDPRGGDLIKGLAGGMGKLMDRVKDKGKSALEAAKDGTNGADSALHGAGSDVISGFVEYIHRGFGRVQDMLRRLTDLLPDWKGPRSTDKVILREAGQLVIQGFVDGLESQFSLVRDSLGSLSDEIGDTTLAAPSVAKISQADMKSLRSTVGAQIAVSGAADGSTDQAAQAPIVFQIDNHNPVAEPTSVTVTKALRTAGQMGVLGG